MSDRGKPNFCRNLLESTYSTGSLGAVRYGDKAGMVRGIWGCVCGSRGGVSLPLASCSASLLVILDRYNKEDQQGDALDPCQEEEVVVQRAVIDITKVFVG